MALSMDDWSEPFRADFRYMRVDRRTGNETAALGGFGSGGSIERNSDTETKESGSASYVGTLDVGADLVRVYMDATGLVSGDKRTVALGTFLPEVTSRDVDGPLSTSTVNLYGRLKELVDDGFEHPVTIAKGADPVAAAVEMAEGAGLTVLADTTGYRLSSAWTFGMGGSDDEGATKLSAINALLDVAGFASASTDAMGRVVMERYHEPTARQPTWGFTEGPSARFSRSATDERDASDVANVVKAVYTTSERTVIGSAEDTDPASPYSTVSLGRRIVKTYEYQDEVTQTEADAKAAELLRTQMSVVRRVTVEHVYCPATIGDVVDVEYPTGGIAGRFAVRKQQISLTAGCPVKSEVVSYDR